MFDVFVPDEGHNLVQIKPSTRAAQYGTTLVMDVLNQLGSELLAWISRVIKSLVPSSDSPNFAFDTVGELERVCDFSDDIVETGTKSSTSDNCCIDSFGVEVEVAARVGCKGGLVVEVGGKELSKTFYSIELVWKGLSYDPLYTVVSNSEGTIHAICAICTL